MYGDLKVQNTAQYLSACQTFLIVCLYVKNHLWSHTSMCQLTHFSYKNNKHRRF